MKDGKRLSAVSKPDSTSTPIRSASLLACGLTVSPMAGGLAALFAADKSAPVASHVDTDPAIVAPPATLDEVINALRAVRDAGIVLRGIAVSTYS